MFNFEKIVNSSIFKYADLLYKIIFVNIMVVLLSLPVVTFVPGLIAGYAQIRNYMNDKEGPLFKSFIIELKRNFYRNFKIGLIVIVVGLLLVNNIYFFNSHLESGLPYIIGLYVTLIIFFFYILTVLNIPLTSIYFERFNEIKILKISFYIGVKYVFTTILLLVPLSITVLLAMYLFPIFTFIGIGFPIFIILKISEKNYKRFNNEE